MNNIQQFVLKGQEVYAGLEDSKSTWKLCVRSDGRIVNETSMPANYSNLHNFFINKFPNCAIHVMYEAGFSGFSLHDNITQDNWDCVVVPPHTVTEEKCNRLKNDTIDCRRLAKNLENNDYKICFVPDKQLREDRQLSRMYAQMKKDTTRVCNRIRRALEFHGLDNCFKPGRWSNHDYKILLDTLNKLEISSTLQFVFVQYMQELEHLWAMKKNILAAIKELARTERYKRSVEILTSTPGIGLLTAMRLILEWGDLSRFRRKESFATFLGLTPSEHSSGEVEHKGHITKQGSRQIRMMLIESSWIALRYDPVLLDKFRRVKQHSGSSKKAIVAVARKLAIRLRSILLSDQLYQIGLIR